MVISISGEANSEPHHYHKGSPIWWRIAGTRPSWIPKTRPEQAGWVKEVNRETGVAFIAVLNEGREEEIYAVSLSSIRPRIIY